MKKIYFDQAATSYPKPESVVNSMVHYIREIGVNINRSGYDEAYEALVSVYNVREKISSFFDFDGVKNVIFTPNVTTALNMILKGYLKKGDHVLVSSMEHNAVMRPLVSMEQEGRITFDRIPCNEYGELCLECVEKMILPNTTMIVMTHASNVCGTILPIEEVGDIAKKYGIKFVVDTAQTAGVLPISIRNCHIDALAFTGHKGLLGPLGIGGFIITSEMAKANFPLILGGTGSYSDLETMPEILPDKFESGTLNIPGILGLNAGIDEIYKIGLNEIHKKELLLTKEFINGIQEIDGIRIIGKTDIVNRVAVVSIQTEEIDEAELAYLLDKEYGIMTRVGMHCAPNAHKTLGTFPRGTLRFSFGYHNSLEEIEFVLKLLRKI